MKKMVAVLSTFFLAAILFCFPVSAYSDNLDIGLQLSGIKPTVEIYRGSSRLGEATVTSSSNFFPISSGNIPFSVSVPSSFVSWDRFDFFWKFDRLNFSSGTDYSFSFLFLAVLWNSDPTYIKADICLFDGSSSSRVLEVARSNVWGYQGFDFAMDSSLLSGLSGADGVRVRVYTMAVTNLAGTFYFSPRYSGFNVTGSLGDQLINGDGTPLAPNVDQDLDNKSDEMGQLENEALGGKSDEEIQQEVDNALSFDVGSLDSSATGSMSGFFDDLLGVFGADYQALLMLALSLGLAAFILGRRYS